MLAKQQQDRGDQRTGMTNPDPPDEIRDGKAPAHWNVDAPNAHPGVKQIGNRNKQAQRQQKGDAKADQPAARRGWRRTNELIRSSISRRG